MTEIVCNLIDDVGILKGLSVIEWRSSNLKRRVSTFDELEVELRHGVVGVGAQSVDVVPNVGLAPA